jgi:hypothetical protein
MKQFELDFFLISNCDYHYKNAFYFKKHFYYSIGLSYINLDPRLIDFALPSFSNNPIIEYVFLKMITSFHKNVLQHKFYFHKKRFNSLTLQKLLI